MNKSLNLLNIYINLWLTLIKPTRLLHYHSKYSKHCCSNDVAIQGCQKLLFREKLLVIHAEIHKFSFSYSGAGCDKDSPADINSIIRDTNSKEHLGVKRQRLTCLKMRTLKSRVVKLIHGPPTAQTGQMD